MKNEEVKEKLADLKKRYRDKDIDAKEFTREKDKLKKIIRKNRNNE